MPRALLRALLKRVLLFKISYSPQYLIFILHIDPPTKHCDLDLQSWQLRPQQFCLVQYDHVLLEFVQDDLCIKWNCSQIKIYLLTWCMFFHWSLSVVV